MEPLLQYGQDHDGGEPEAGGDRALGTRDSPRPKRAEVHRGGRHDRDREQQDRDELASWIVRHERGLRHEEQEPDRDQHSRGRRSAAQAPDEDGQRREEQADEHRVQAEYVGSEDGQCLDDRHARGPIGIRERAQPDAVPLQRRFTIQGVHQGEVGDPNHHRAGQERGAVSNDEGPPP